MVTLQSENKLGNNDFGQYNMVNVKNKNKNESNRKWSALLNASMIPSFNDLNEKRLS